MRITACFRLAAALVVLGGTFSSTLAGPSLPINKPPVQSAALLTGPSVDPASTNGQWFIDQTGAESVRANEFYDETLGGPAGFNAITGYVDSITFAGGPGTPIVAFTIQATIINDASTTGSWSSGSNRHGETLSYQGTPYAGPLVDTQLAAEFAIADTNKLPIVFQGPYRDRTNYIVAVNEDQFAWYCWNPDDQNPEHKPSGGYFVPTWDFGTIQYGQSASRKLSFVVLNGMPPIDSRYPVIVQSFAQTNDVLMNRTLSLKISTWIDEIARDTGAQQEEPPLRLSDVSVFHNLGEPEPYMDFGDAPDTPYPTLLANDGARHIVVPGIYMGSLIDPEGDGQPDATATGDDKALLDDEDGVVFLGQFISGQTTTVQVTVSTSGYINAWIDYNADGDWADVGEQIMNMVYAPSAGIYSYVITVPPQLATTNTFARFRFATPQSPLSYTGLAPDGEVEDYELRLFAEGEELLDFGDAWDSMVTIGYPTLLAHNGARHVIQPGIYLGQRVDAELNGQPTPSADGDDNNPPVGLDDEDGVTLPAIFYAGASNTITVVASTNGFLDAWIDWNCNMSWANPGEHVFVQTPLAAGINVLSLTVPLPPTLVPGGPHSRWRFTTIPSPGLSYTGLVANGEVEDHEVQLDSLDLGDAPAPYPTLLADNGARHRIPSAYWLGVTAPDNDPDGQPEAEAQGDDNTGMDDEDGVFSSGSLVQGMSGMLDVIASTNGYLNAWMDFNADGDWSDSGEQIATNLSLPAGINPLPLAIPTNALVGSALARFRFGSMAGLGVTGLATDGEVEDHTFILYQNDPDTNNFIITNIVHTTTNEMEIWWAAETSVVYEAQFTTNLLNATDLVWTAWGGYVIGPTNWQTDTNAAERLRYYRVVVPYSPPPP
jgi:hypothetical protein